MATSKSDDLVITDTITEEQKPWFVSFVKWHKKNYGAKLDPDNLWKVNPANETEAIFLNFLKKSHAVAQNAHHAKDVGK